MTLREFFVELLHDDNLVAYYENREDYITRKEKQENGLSPDDAELLRTGSLGDIERRILAEANSPGPKPYLIVWPPM